MNRQIEPIQNLLSEVQGYISREYPAALSGRDDHGQLLRSYIEKYLRQNAAAPDGMSFSETVDYLYREMAEFSILTPYLGREDVEEINVNSWDDVSVSYTDGHKDKLAQGFLSPTHARDVIRRLLRQSNTIIDNAVPKAEGRLPNNSRIAAMIPPITDPDSGASAAIRLLHPSKITRDEIIASGEANDEMMDFLCLCIRYGVSFLIAGITGSGKTTLLNALLKTLPDEKRIFTIESGSREFALIRRGSDDRVMANLIYYTYLFELSDIDGGGDLSLKTDNLTACFLSPLNRYDIELYAELSLNHLQNRMMMDLFGSIGSLFCNAFRQTPPPQQADPERGVDHRLKRQIQLKKKGMNYRTHRSAKPNPFGRLQSTAPGEQIHGQMEGHEKSICKGEGRKICQDPIPYDHPVGMLGECRERRFRSEHLFLRRRRRFGDLRYPPDRRVFAPQNPSHPFAVQAHPTAFVKGRIG